MNGIDEYYNNKHRSSLGRMSPFEFFQTVLCPLVNKSKDEEQTAIATVANVMLYNDKNDLYDLICIKIQTIGFVLWSVCCRLISLNK